MNPPNLRDRNLIASLSPHIDAAIRASPCTCATLRHDVILDLVLRHGLDPDRRIPEFLRLCDAAQEKFIHATSRCENRPSAVLKISDVHRPLVPSSEVDERNSRLNDLYQTHKLGLVVRDCEELAAAYNASLWYSWPNATVLSRFIGGYGELKSMLALGKFHSIYHNFVATSITQSSWFIYRPVSYRIKVTDQYRKRASPLTYTSVFAIAHPEVIQGPKSVRYLEDEIRLENGTPIEKDTLEITFYYKTPPSKSHTKDLIETYSSLGPVHIECC